MSQEFQINDQVQIKPQSQIDNDVLCPIMKTWAGTARSYQNLIGYIKKVDFLAVPTCYLVEFNDGNKYASWFDFNWLIPLKDLPSFVGLCDECGGINQHEKSCHLLLTHK